MVYSGAWGKLIHEKNQKKKSRDTVPLIITYQINLISDESISLNSPLKRQLLGLFWDILKYADLR